MDPYRKIPRFYFEDPDQRGLDLNITSTIVDNGRRLRVTWTPELHQDLQSFHGIDVDSEITRLLSEHVAAEIDRDIMNSLWGDLVPNLDRLEERPIPSPQGLLFYLDYTYQTGPETTIYDEDWSWSSGNAFYSNSGINMVLYKHEFNLTD